MTALGAAGVTNKPRNNNGSPISDDELSLDEIQMIRIDWKALGDANKQKKMIEDMFKYVFNNFEHMKPIWAFGRNRMKNVDDLAANPAFTAHVGQVTAAVSTMVSYLHNPRSLLHCMNELGSRHFFYEAIEPHYDLLQVAFLHSLQWNRSNYIHWTTALADAWRKAFVNAKRGMQNGLRSARFQYLATSITAQEMVTVCSLWEKVKQHGLKEAGISFCNAAIRSYEELVSDSFGSASPVAIRRLDTSTLNKFAADAMMALNAAVQSYNPDIGFADLPNSLAPFANEYYFTEASPILVRKALMEGLLNMMTYAVGEVAMTEPVQHTWMKLYRIVEQSVIANIVSH